MPDLLNIALTGLQAQQNALTVTGHNIANANTQGYSRQQAVNITRNPQVLAGLSFGTGVETGSVRRSVNEFFTGQVRNDTAALNHAETLRLNLDQLDFVLADSNTGLSSSLERFFGALQGTTDNPSSIPARQVLLNESQSLVNKFHALSQIINDQDITVNQQIDGVANQISVAAAEIANLNGLIAQSGGLGQGSEPNDLLDRRDDLLRQLSSLVGISTVPQDNGTTNVFIGNGQALVLGDQSVQLVTQEGALDPGRRELAILAGNRVTGVSDNISGGVLGGLLEFRNSVLDEAAASVGRVAIAVSDAINTQHNLGLDVQGNLGLDFFTDINGAQSIAERVLPDDSNSLPRDQLVEVRIADVGQLNPSDYQLTFTASDRYVITRLSDGKTNTDISPTLSGNLPSVPGIVVFDGLAVTLDRPTGGFAAGDRFLLQPTRHAARDIELGIAQPEQVALAAPIRTASDLNNQGTGTISAGSVTNTSVPLFSSNAGQLSPPLLIRFTSATTYDVLDNSVPGAPVALTPPLTGLAFPPTPANGLLPGNFGIEVSINGQPQAGDTFNIDFNSGAVQDNRNGLALVGLQTERLLDSGTATFSSAYGKLLQSVGSRTADARVNEQAGKTLLLQSSARRESVSGVNLDEEAARLIEFEQAYNASAQVINVARQLFDVLLSATR